jgi:hypothetical protein
MTTFEYSKIIPCPPKKAWSAVADFPARTLHSRRYRRANLPDGPDLEPGHRIELQIGRDRFTSLITIAEKGETLTHRASGPGFSVEFSYRVRECNDGDEGYTSDDAGHTHLTVRAEYGGWLGSIIAGMRPGSCRRYVSDEMAAITSATETVPAEPVAD